MLSPTGVQKTRYGVLECKTGPPCQDSSSVEDAAADAGIAARVTSRIVTAANHTVVE
jgi:hypothetical protein